MKTFMKNLTKILLVISVVLCVSGVALANAYTSDSEIDPIEFYNWTVVEKHQTGPGEGTAVIENPDPNAKIKRATIKISEGSLLSYSYVIDGKTYEYKFNYETKNYDLIKE